MRRFLSTAIFTFWVVLIAGIPFHNFGNADDSPPIPLAPIRITDEGDHLRLINSYQAVLASQAQFENAILRAKVKYKVPIDYSYNFDTGQFEPPVVKTAPPIKNVLSSPVNPAQPAPKPK